jgi:hypothetical protein
VAAILGRVERHHDLVTLTRADLVVAARAPIRLHRFVRLHVSHADVVQRRHGSAQQGPEHEDQRDRDPRDDEEQVATMTDSATERVHPHEPTLPRRSARGRVGPARHRPAPRSHGRRRGQWAVIDGMRMLCARAARAELARSQSGSLVRRTNELCASHSAVHDVHVSRYEPPE